MAQAAATTISVHGVQSTLKSTHIGRKKIKMKKYRK